MGYKMFLLTAFLVNMFPPYFVFVLHTAAVTHLVQKLCMVVFPSEEENREAVDCKK